MHGFFFHFSILDLIYASAIQILGVLAASDEFLMLLHVYF